MTSADADRPIQGSEASQLFEAERDHLQGVAYRLLGTASDADDVVQEVFARWLSADRADVDNPAAYLTTMTTRAAIDRLRSAQKKREVYVGPWLPEPVVTAAGPSSTSTFGDPADLAELDESLTIGFLHLLEQLKPLERACYLLHDVYDFSYSEIAAMVDRSEDNCRQLASRGRSKLRADRPSEISPPTSSNDDEILGQFLAAVTSGDVEAVIGLLTDDAVYFGDGGALVRAARAPVVGPERIAHLIVNLTARWGLADDSATSDPGTGDPASSERPSPLDLRFLRLNNRPALLIFDGQQPTMSVVFELAQDRVHRIYAVLNPDKLAATVKALQPDASNLDAR